MLNNYMFPSFFVFILWSLFADIEDRLTLLLTNEINKRKKYGSRSDKRETDRNKKDDESAHDSSAVHGFPLRSLYI